MAPPILTPPALHFMVTAFAYVCGTHLCTFTCTTDTPVRLTVHLSPERPAIRRIPYVKRGAPFVLSSVTCFVESTTIVQTEVGDSLTHTFLIPFPVYDHMYYWYLTGTQGGVACASVSQIFWHRCPAPSIPYVICQAPPNMDSRTFQHTICYDDSYVKIKPGVSLQPSMLTVYVRWGPYAPQPKSICLSLWTTLITGYPGVKIGGNWFFIWNPINNGLPQAVDVPLPGCPALTAGQHYEFRVVYAYDGVKAGYWYTSLDSTNTCPPSAGYSNLVRIRKNWVWPCCGSIIGYSPGYGQSASGYKLWGLPI